MFNADIKYILILCCNIFYLQALLSDLPPELEEMDFNHASPEPDDTSFSLSSLSEKNASDSLWFIFF